MFRCTRELLIPIKVELDELTEGVKGSFGSGSSKKKGARQLSTASVLDAADATPQVLPSRQASASTDAEEAKPDANEANTPAAMSDGKTLSAMEA